MAAPYFVDCQRTCMTQMTKDFAMRHDESYVEWNGISIKWYQFVTNCPYHQTIYSKHNICSFEFLWRFHDSFASRLRNQIRTTVMENWHIINFFINFTWYHWYHHNYQVECVICWEKYFWWLRRFKNLRSTTCKHRRKYYRKCDVIHRYLHIELIWRLLMVQYLQNNVIMKWATRFIRFTGWIPLKYGSTTTPPIIAHCQKTPMSSVVFHTAILKPPI